MAFFIIEQDMEPALAWVPAPSPAFYVTEAGWLTSSPSLPSCTAPALAYYGWNELTLGAWLIVGSI